MKTYQELWDELNEAGHDYDDSTLEEDMIDVCGLTGHPMAANAFHYAYMNGHASGYVEVLQNLSELADMVILNED